jgi:hypothetical protein
MPAGLSDKTLSFTGDMEVTDAVSTSRRSLKTGQSLELTDSPILIARLPDDLVKQARANAVKSFPWGGDYSSVQSVRYQPGFPDVSQGIVPIGRADRPSVKFADGSTGVLVPGDINHPVSFYVHPSFASFQTKEYHVRVSVRRVAAGNVGMNLIYEVADSQGRMPYKNTGKWFGVTKENGWQTYTWHVTDACFSKMWGYDFSIRPEQSIPFVIGKVEVSTVPFP